MDHNKQQVQQQQQQQVASPTTSRVAEMFAGRSVFITGATGFIGRVLLEKLLRSYGKLKRVYILMRPKKGMAPKERLHKMLLAAPIFDHIKSLPNGAELLAKIHVINGDIGQENLGISSSDLRMLLTDESLGLVFHSAATVKFDEPLKLSVQSNLIATSAIIELCKQMKNLLALCHVSTAFTNSHLKNQEPIEEKLYPIEHTPEQVIRMAQIMDEKLMQQVQETLVGERPNTYTYTKALGEHLIANHANELPVAIVRPSIVVGAWREPLEGWVDNLNGPTGLMLAIGKGLLRSMQTLGSAVADMVPVDVVVNTMIAASYYAAQTNGKLTPQTAAHELEAATESQIRTNHHTDNTLTSEQQPQLEEEEEAEQEEAEAELAIERRKQQLEKWQKQPAIFHCNSGDLNPITWGEMEDFVFPIIRKYPSQQVFRYPFGTFKSNKYHDLVTRIFVHYLPALLIDLLCIVMGKKPQLFKIYCKLNAATEALVHFRKTNYLFKTKNLALLHDCLRDSPDDQRDLYMDIEKMDWAEFWDRYVLGCRRYILKEKDSTLEESRRSLLRAYYIELAFRTLLLLLAIACCLMLATRHGSDSKGAAASGFADGALPSTTIGPHQPSPPQATTTATVTNCSIAAAALQLCLPHTRASLAVPPQLS